MLKASVLISGQISFLHRADAKDAFINLSRELSQQDRAKVTAIYLSGLIDDDIISLITSYPNLSLLSLTTAQIDLNEQTCLQLLDKCQIKHLFLTNTTFDASRLRFIWRLPLLTLGIDGTDFSDADATVLSEFSELTVLDISRTPVSLEGLKPLASVSSLSHLSAADCPNLPPLQQVFDQLEAWQKAEKTSSQNSGPRFFLTENSSLATLRGDAQESATYLSLK